MSVSKAFRSPFFRVPFLAFAVFATVATSQARWSLEASPIDEDITLAPGASLERRVEYEASQAVGFATKLSGAGVDGASVRVANEDSSSAHPDLDDARFDAGPSAGDAGAGVVRGCDGQWSFRWIEGRWRPLDRDGNVRETFATTTMHAAGSCDTKEGTVAVKVTNLGESEVKLRMSTEVLIVGAGDSDPPDGAFVRAKVVP